MTSRTFFFFFNLSAGIFDSCKRCGFCLRLHFFCSESSAGAHVQSWGQVSLEPATVTLRWSARSWRLQFSTTPPGRYFLSLSGTRFPCLWPFHIIQSHLPMWILKGIFKDTTNVGFFTDHMRCFCKYLFKTNTKETTEFWHFCSFIFSFLWLIVHFFGRHSFTVGLEHVQKKSCKFES